MYSEKIFINLAGTLFKVAHRFIQGVITVANNKTLDRETVSSFRLNVQATDNPDGEDSKLTSVPV